MSNYQKMAVRQRKWLLYIIVVIGLLSMILPNQAFFLGLLLGAVVSFYNLWLLQRRTNLLGEMAEKSGKRTGIGTISRLAMAALGTLLAVRYDLSIPGFIIGIMLMYPIIMIDFLLYHRKQHTKAG